MVSLEDRVRVVQSEAERLKQYLSARPTDAWSLPSACDRWQVRDVVAHMVFGAEHYAEWLSRGLQDDSSPPEGFPEAGTVNGASAADFIDQGSVSRQESLGDQLLSTFNETSDQLNQLLAGLNASNRDKPCYHAGGLFPARAFLDMRIAELAVHGWDIRSRLEPSAHLSAESLPALMDVIQVWWVGWLFQPGSQLPAPVRYRFEMTGAVPSRNDILVEGDKAHMEPAEAAEANVTFRCDTETFVLMMFGRLTLDAAVAANRLEVDGDRGLAAEFGRWFPGA